MMTGRLLLRPLRDRDAELVYRYRSIDEISCYQAWIPADRAEVREFIDKMSRIEPDTPGTWYQLAICLRESGELIGDCGLHFPAASDFEAEIGITLAPEHQGRGYAAEALGLLFEYLFESLQKHRVFCSVDPRNHASLRLMERAGMRKEAHFRKSLRIRGSWVDDVVYALLEEEWRANSGRS